MLLLASLMMIPHGISSHELDGKQKQLLDYVRTAASVYGTVFPHGRAKLEFETYGRSDPSPPRSPEGKHSPTFIQRPPGSPLQFAALDLMWDEDKVRVDYKGYINWTKEGDGFESVFAKR